MKPIKNKAMKSLLAREEVRIFAAPAYLFAISNFLITNIDTIKIWITKAGLGKVEELLEEMLYCIEELSVKSEKEINNFHFPQTFDEYGYTEKYITIKVNTISLFMIIQLINLHRKIVIDNIIIEDQGLDLKEELSKCLESIIETATAATQSTITDYNGLLN